VGMILLHQKEETFKSSKKTRKSKKNSNSNCSYNDDLDEYEEIVNLVSKLKRGVGKYKGKLPLKIIKCGKIGHVVAKCPYAKNSKGDEEEVHKKEKKCQKGNKRGNKKKVFKKIHY
jgi:hypothetical protein